MQRALAKAFPPRVPGKRAAGNRNGLIKDQRDYFAKCLANGGRMDNDAGKARLKWTGLTASAAGYGALRGGTGQAFRGFTAELTLVLADTWSGCTALTSCLPASRRPIRH